MSHVVLPEVSHPIEEKSFSQPSFRKRFQKRFGPHVPLLVLDEEGLVQHLTPAAAHLLRFHEEDTGTTSFFSLVHGRNLYQVMRDIADMVCYRKSKASWLIRLRTGQGRWQWFKANVQNQLSTDGAITIALRDIQE